MISSSVWNAASSGFPFPFAGGQGSVLIPARLVGVPGLGCLVAFGTALLFQQLREDAGADGAAALADGEPQAFLNRHGGWELFTK